jgi:NitT/TauT family transport system substrate-binding protein
MRGKFFKLTGLWLAAALLLSACGNIAPTPSPPPDATSTTTIISDPTPTTGTTSDLQKVTIALGYIPDVQFAPFYLALNKGYYRDEGLDVTLRNGIVPDLIPQLGAGEGGVNFAAVSGDEVIPARLQGIPVSYVMTWYRQYPVAAVSIEGKGPSLKTPADLKGHKVGVPGPYGSSYVGLLALLKSAGLTLKDIQMESVGFTQVPSLLSGQVEVAMVYAANEPVQLRSQGTAVSTLKVADYMHLASNGLATNDRTINENPELVTKVVRATLKGIADTIADPEAAFESSLKQVPEAGQNRDLQLEILRETVKLMQANPADSDRPELQPGWTDRAVWEQTQDFLLEAELIEKKGNVDEMFTNRFVEEAAK